MIRQIIKLIAVVVIPFLFTVSILFITSCNNNNNKSSHAKVQHSFVTDSVHQLIETIATTISSKGPASWINFFENSPDFFMASQGQLAFPSTDSAKNFITHTLVKTIIKIELHWSNIRIDSLSNDLASVGANFHEELTDSSGNRIPADGYFTAIAHQTSQSWKLRNLHWSIVNQTSGK